jgi:hypothetical protein
MCQNRRWSDLCTQDTGPACPDRPTPDRPKPTQNPNPSPSYHRETTPTPRLEAQEPRQERLTWCEPPHQVMLRPFQLVASPRAEQSVQVEMFRRERASSRLDSWRGSHTFHRRPSAPTVQQQHLHARRNTAAARLHGLRASKIPTIRRMGAETAQHMGFKNSLSPETRRKNGGSLSTYAP